MVTTRHGSASGSEDSDLRDLIGSQVNEVLQQLLPGLFAQMKDELLQAFDERIEAAFTARGSAAGSSGQAQSRTVTFKDFMACQPPHYEGQKDPIACSRWIAAVEGAFRTSGCPAGSKVFFAVNLLRNAGKDWWGLILKSRTEAQIDSMTWDEFKVMFDEQFAPRIEKERITTEFLRLTQTTETVNEITDQFLEKSLFCPDYVNNDSMKMFRYLRILRPDIKEVVTTARCKSFTEMVEVARTRELYLDELQAKKRKQEQPQMSSKKQKQAGYKPEGIRDFPKCSNCGRYHPGECRAGAGVCYKCGKPGHMSRDCRENPKTCFHCYQPGHFKSQCPMLVDATVQAPAPTTLRITDGSSGSKGGATASRGRAFQLTAEEAKAAPDMVSGVSHSFVSYTCCKGSDPTLGKLDRPLAVELADAKIWMWPTCSEDSGIEVPIGLIPTRMKEINVIVGIDWPRQHQAMINASAIEFELKPSGGELGIKGRGNILMNRNGVSAQKGDRDGQSAVTSSPWYRLDMEVGDRNE
ncbi:hypothetical protein OSB04_018920 [Centaurea solstitialis]|uniref:CCHC-type domain-containing protein n=1 Tax=Centaurea solstitialis TaxID=347529 RepID=A0AA38W4J8_9ASTR|nr:hypothetical protein OSB04_018920 [Centaurea solstitialis]